MNNSTGLPIGSFGEAVPVGNLKTKATQPVTLTSNAVVYATNVFSGKAQVMASATITGDSEGEVLTLTSKIKGAESERISVIVNEAGAALLIAVTGNNAIAITPKADSTFKDVAAAIAANPAANALVECSYEDAEDAFVVDASQAKKYLDGWNAGGIGCYVRLWGTAAFFYGKYSEAETTPKTASTPVSAGVEAWEYVEAGDKISLKSATNGAIVYVTPAKQM